MKLEICDVSKQYKDKCAVDHASLTLTPGVWGLLGANGAGKTTLMRMIAGIMKPTGGEIRYDGSRSAQWEKNTEISSDICRRNSDSIRDSRYRIIWNIWLH